MAALLMLYICKLIHDKGKMPVLDSDPVNSISNHVYKKRRFEVYIANVNYDVIRQ